VQDHVTGNGRASAASANLATAPGRFTPERWPQGANAMTLAFITTPALLIAAIAGTGALLGGVIVWARSRQKRSILAAARARVVELTQRMRLRRGAELPRGAHGTAPVAGIRI
jgi:hypothetical protein